MQGILWALIISAKAKLHFTGVNSAGLEFGINRSQPSTIPGLLNTNYFAAKEASLISMIDSGVNTVRLCFSWERLISDLSNQQLNRGYLGLIEESVNTVTARNATILLDMHNYARYFFKNTTLTQHVLGDGTLKQEHFVNSWKLISAHFESNNNVAFGLMNEPYNLPDNGATYVNGVIEIIREIRKNSQQYVFVCGTDWSGAHSWMYNNAEMMMPLVAEKFTNVVFDMHQYLDSDYSGTNVQCASARPDLYFAAATSWLITNKQVAILGEIGVVSACIPKLNIVLDYLNTTSPWVGFTYWAAGPKWDNSYPMFYVESEQGVGGKTFEALQSYFVPPFRNNDSKVSSAWRNAQPYWMAVALALAIF